jgi:hypothetical protein
MQKHCDPITHPFYPRFHQLIDTQSHILIIWGSFLFADVYILWNTIDFKCNSFDQEIKAKTTERVPRHILNALVDSANCPVSPLKNSERLTISVAKFSSALNYLGVIET